MNVASLVLGILALLGFLVGFLPCLGAMNWVNVPFAVVGAIISIVALAKAEVGDKGMPIAGLVLCLIAVFFGVIRLIAGGGLL